MKNNLQFFRDIFSNALKISKDEEKQQKCFLFVLSEQSDILIKIISVLKQKDIKNIFRRGENTHLCT